MVGWIRMIVDNIDWLIFSEKYKSVQQINNYVINYVTRFIKKIMKKIYEKIYFIWILILPYIGKVYNH